MYTLTFIKQIIACIYRTEMQFTGIGSNKQQQKHFNLINYFDKNCNIVKLKR